MADDNLVNQDEIEQLLNQAKQEVGASAPEGDAAADAAAAQPNEADQPDSAAPAAAAAASPMDASDDKMLAQDDIEKLLSQTGTVTAQPATDAGPASDAPDQFLPGEGSVPQRDVEFLFNQAERALESIDTAGQPATLADVRSFRLEEFSGAPVSTETTSLDLIRDVELNMKIELGRTHMYLEDVLKLRKGSVVPLDKLAGDPVDIYVNGRLIARGEVLVLNDNFCVRVVELIAGTSAAA